MSNVNKQRLAIVAAIGCGCAALMVPVIGVISAVAIPNFLDAMEKARQKRTVADIRSTGTAFMSWVVDQQGTELPPGWAAGDTLGIDQLASQLVPSYLASVPATDGWGHAFVIEVLGEDLSATPLLRISSPGRDGFFDPQRVDGAFDSFEYDRDIVWQDGFFASFPEGAGSP